VGYGKEVPRTISVGRNSKDEEEQNRGSQVITKKNEVRRSISRREGILGIGREKGWREATRKENFKLSQGSGALKKKNNFRVDDLQGGGSQKHKELRNDYQANEEFSTKKKKIQS